LLRFYPFIWIKIDFKKFRNFNWIEMHSKDQNLDLTQTKRIHFCSFQSIFVCWEYKKRANESRRMNVLISIYTHKLNSNKHFDPKCITFSARSLNIREKIIGNNIFYVEFKFARIISPVKLLIMIHLVKTYSEHVR